MKAYRYRLPLREPLPLASGVLSVREGLLVTDGRGAWGEAAPLPGFSRESLSQVIDAWRGGATSGSAALRFASDALHADASATDTSMAVPIGALLVGDRERILAAAGCLAKTACRSVKLKVGRGRCVGEDAGLVREVRRCLRPEQALRLDANRAWDFATAVDFAQAVAPCAIEYIEEPLQQPCQLEPFRQQTGCDYALDETLLESPDLREYPGVAALIIKPTLLGGSADIQPLAATGVPLVFSACFESGIGIRQIGRLAKRWAPSTPAGLDTYSCLAQDVLRRPLEIRDWMLTLESRVDVNLDMLEEIR